VKHARKELWFEVPKRRAYLNITPPMGGVHARERHRERLPRVLLTPAGE
jgi:hypothetical protein